MPAHLRCCVRRPRSAICAPPHAQDPPIPPSPASVRVPPPQERPQNELRARESRRTTSFTGPPPPARSTAGQPRLGFGGPAQGVTAVGPRHLPQPHRGGPLPPPRRPPRPHQARLWLFARCAPRALRAARTGARSLLLTSFFQPPRPPSQAHPLASQRLRSDPARWQASEGPGASGIGVAPEAAHRRRLLAAVAARDGRGGLGRPCGGRRRACGGGCITIGQEAGAGGREGVGGPQEAEPPPPSH